MAAGLAGMDDTLEALREALSWPMQYSTAAVQLGVRWPKGLLLHGPPGCGKTAAVHAVALECGAAMHLVTAASIVGAFTGESERRLRDVFAAANKDAEAGQLVVIFLDEVDSLCPRRESARQQEARIVGQLLTLLDGATALGPQCKQVEHGKQRLGHILVVGATSRPNAVDPALRRPGRLEREILVPIPDAAARTSILRLLTQRLPLDGSVDLQQLAFECHGYTGADLGALCREAGMSAIAFLHTAPRSMMRLVTADDFVAAMKRVGPSMARGAAVEYRPINWDDIGGLSAVKQQLKQAVEWPLRHSGAFERLGLSPPRGVLLHGPPGCSKTTLVRAAATASGATLIPLSGTQLYSMHVGEGEAILRETFRRARLVAPSIVFLDELDSLVGKRVDREIASDVTARVLSSFLTEMDGLELAQGVLVMGATNRPQALDAALIRPGRFDVILYVPPPDELGRLQALQIHTRKIPLTADVNLATIAACTDCFTGAELAAVCREAALAALREDIEGARRVHPRHFTFALGTIQPHLTAADLAEWEAWPERAARS
ncbi:hypothetical protein CHLNCDRAFT_37221 [Chlorella variabilis]|uniref:AAA+ ATPase domain-containing protein n=1 Tax=Chlorella variabilis TaxID=554065 RepID=E1ZQS7_CHLVA|nr:hypothetical protein CHLNCDRAFT_37221 [Chlorella variabilis]EFN51849.1 hypothetical protein CHLNCDRAFT_37221 [Chlorella variabilis]|eukprot:XP_005843951.1 hypothetical protein CHLNCDRAFT_37221 [Chlorella variabilis]